MCEFCRSATHWPADFKTHQSSTPPTLQAPPLPVAFQDSPVATPVVSAGANINLSVATDSICARSNIGLLANLLHLCPADFRTCRQPASPTSAGSNIDLLAEQIRQFQPKLVAIKDASRVKDLQELIKDVPQQPEILVGAEGAVEVARHPEVDAVITGQHMVAYMARCAGHDGTWQPCVHVPALSSNAPPTRTSQASTIHDKLVTSALKRTAVIKREQGCHVRQPVLTLQCRCQAPCQLLHCSHHT